MTTEDPNSRQVGGDHYARGGEFQHWDLVELYGLGYLEGCATKYLVRWRDKNGLEDLRKARHYVEKLARLHNERGRGPRGKVPLPELARFFKAYPGLDRERTAVMLLCDDWDEVDLQHAIEVIDNLIRDNNGQLQDRPG